MDDETTTPELTAIIPDLPFVYDEEDSRVVAILNEVATFCGKEFTEVPPNPDGEPNPDYDPTDPTSPPKEGGDIMPLDDEPEDNDKNQDGIPDIEEPASPAEPYPEGPSDELDKLREAYKEALAKNKEEKASYWSLLWQVIRLISSMACWTETDIDTFIIQHRKQIYSAKQANGCAKNCCKCDEDQIVIPIDYAPLEYAVDEDNNPIEKEFKAKPFIGGVISVVIDGKRQETKIGQSYLNEHYDPYTQKLYIMRDDFADALYQYGKECCLCLRDLTITLYYNAGYYTIPKTLLPLVCQLMSKIEDSKKPLSDCSAALTQVSGLLKSMKTGDIQYTWSDNDNRMTNTQNLFGEIYNIAVMAELFSVSRCAIVNDVIAGDVI